jgi:hypothetical protein
MSDARGYVYDEGIGLRMTRQNTFYKSGITWKQPFKVYYLDIKYDEDKNGNPLFDTDGKKKIKTKKWEPFVHAVPLPGETITGGTEHHFVRYEGLTNTSAATSTDDTLSLNPLHALQQAGYDVDAICNMPGNVTFNFTRVDSGETIRRISFGYNLTICERFNSIDYLIHSLGGGWDNGENSGFSFPVQCSELRYLRNLTDAQRLVLVWNDYDPNTYSINKGWNPNFSTSYSMTF